MNEKHCFTEQEKTELLSNPYTARVTDYRVEFTLEFKQFIIENVDRPGMTYQKLYELAGYRPGLFKKRTRNGQIQRIRDEAASPEGLQPPKMPKVQKRKKHSDTQIQELLDRVELLEQQIEFLKKSQHLKKSKTTPSYLNTD